MQLQFLEVSPLSPREIIPKAEAATRKALELDSTLPLAHRMLAIILHAFYWRWEAGDDEYRHANALEHTGLPREWVALGSLIRTGRADEAVADAERLRRKHPREANSFFGAGIAYRAAGQHQRAIAEFQRASDLVPEWRARAHFQIGATLVIM